MSDILASLVKAARNLNPLQLLNLAIVTGLAILSFLVAFVCNIKHAGFWETVASAIWLILCLGGILVLVVVLVCGIVYIAIRTHGPDVDRIVTRIANYLLILTCMAVLALVIVLIVAPPLAWRVEEVPPVQAQEYPEDSGSRPSSSVVVVRPVAWWAENK